MGQAIRTILVLLLALAAVAAPARDALGRRAPTHFVLLLDNSGSMVGRLTLTHPDGTTEDLPAADPERLSILASLIFHDLMEPEDRLDVIVFPGRVLPAGKDALRAISFDQPTKFREPIALARRLLEASTHEKRRFVLLTDGTPDDLSSPQEARALVGEEPPFQVVSFALATHAAVRRQQQALLPGLGGVVAVNDPQTLVAAFAALFAETREAVPREGSLAPERSEALKIHKYVNRVYVIVTSATPLGPFRTDLVDEAGRSRAAEALAGDNGAGRAYQVYKLDHDPERESAWTLSLPAGATPGDYPYAVIEVYDLAAEITQAPDRLVAGEAGRVEGHLVSRGRHFDDADFFATGDFRATFVAAAGAGPQPASEIPARHDGGGRFSAELRGTEPGPLPVEVRFANRWMALRSAPRTIEIEGYPFGATVAGDGPATALVGEAVDLAVRLVAADGGPYADRRVLADPALQATLTAAGQDVPLVRDPAAPATWRARWTAAAAGAHELVATFTYKGQTQRGTFALTAYWPLSLVVQPSLVDFGPVAAGAPVAETCVTLDLRGSVNADRVPLTVTSHHVAVAAGGLCPGPDAAVLAAEGGSGPLALGSDGTARVCLATTRCASAGAAPTDAAVTIAGADPFYAAGAVRLPVRYEVAPTAWLTCNLWWILTIVGVLLLLFLVWGFVSPHSFGPEDRIWIASREIALKRATARRLRDLPGGRRGFYRSAQVYFNGTGGAVRRRSGFVVGFRAQRRDVLPVVGGATLEVRSGTSHKWEPVAPLEARGGGGPSPIRKNTLYRLGDFYFRIA